MTTTTTEPSTLMSAEDSRRLIDASGGNHAFALLLGLPLNKTTSSRVGHWKRRGIPRDVAREHSKTFIKLRASATRRGML